jgi:hypothetical protein
MSTEIGNLQDTGSRGVELNLTRYWGGDKRGICVQLSATTEEGVGGYVQLSAADIIALLPILKTYIIDWEMGRQKEIAAKAIAEYKELEKSVVSDMRNVSKMAIAQPVFDMAALLFYGKKEVELSDEIKEAQ